MIRCTQCAPVSQNLCDFDTVAGDIHAVAARQCARTPHSQSGCAKNACAPPLKAVESRVHLSISCKRAGVSLGRSAPSRPDRPRGAGRPLLDRMYVSVYRQSRTGLACSLISRLTLATSALATSSPSDTAVASRWRLISHDSCAAIACRGGSSSRPHSPATRASNIACDSICMCMRRALIPRLDNPVYFIL